MALDLLQWQVYGAEYALRLQRVRGHFLNWYDTRDLRPLEPRYISTVDSGNLAGHLIALANACREWSDRPLEIAHRFSGVADVDKLKRLFEAFNEKRDILHLLDQSLRAEGVQIFIGQESGYQILDDVSVVTAPYVDGDSVVGVLGVIGPTRMAYERVIPIVDMTAKLLGAALNSRR